MSQISLRMRSKFSEQRPAMLDGRCGSFSAKILGCEPNWTHTFASIYEKVAFVPTRYRDVAKFDRANVIRPSDLPHCQVYPEHPCCSSALPPDLSGF
jgi:hypothetical protein